jgi:crotonobetainyl-CoA:carnitine CoA-transferase CaiB-like acyl-CoA transferase
MQQNGVAAGTVQNAADLANDQQLMARGFFVKGGDTPFTDASPVKMGDVKVEHKTAPSPGQDNDYVYGKLLGLSNNEMNILKKNGVI